MPLFKWIAFDSAGTALRGTDYARSPALLEELLLQRNLSLAAAKELSVSRKSLSAAQKAACFDYMAAVLSAGMHLPEAFVTTAHASDSVVVQVVLAEGAAALEQGVSLYEVMQAAPQLFDTLSLVVLEAGYRTGQVAQACLLLRDYFKEREAQQQQVKAALRGPLITFSFFLLIGVVVLVLLVPRFKETFSSFKAPPPASTRVLFGVSEVLQAYWYAGMVILVGGVVLWMFVRTLRLYAALKEWILVRIPLVASFVRQQAVVNFLTVYDLLVHAQLLHYEACLYAADAAQNRYIAARFKALSQALEQGQLFSHCLPAYADLFTHDIRALLFVGEQTGNAAHAAQQAALLARRRFAVRLAAWNSSVQPLILVVLGIAVALLVTALYMPLISLMNSVDMQSAV